MKKEQEKQIRWVMAILMNDQASTDEELVEHFEREGGIDHDKAKAIAYYRNDAIQGKEDYVRYQVKEILEGGTGTILDRTQDHCYEAEGVKAQDYVFKTRQERPDIYNQAVDFVKRMGQGGLWRGYYMAVEETIRLIERVEKRTRHNVAKELCDFF